MPQKPEWADYQDKVATFLSQLGFDAQVNETMQGARAAHDIDVTARTEIAGVGQLWLVECKSWKRRVPKERVLTFRGVVEDIGADRGLLFSESGFQAGATQAARSTNITLTSLEDFEQNFAAEVSSARAKALEERITRLMQAFVAIWDLPESERAAVRAQYSGPPGFTDLEGTSHATAGTTACLSQAKQALENARFDRWPVAYFPLDCTDGELIRAKEWEGLLFLIENTLTTCERIHEHMTKPNAESIDWRDLQPPELVAMLDAIRTLKS